MRLSLPLIIQKRSPNWEEGNWDHWYVYHSATSTVYINDFSFVCSFNSFFKFNICDPHDLPIKHFYGSFSVISQSLNPHTRINTVLSISLPAQRFENIADNWYWPNLSSYISQRYRCLFKEKVITVTMEGKKGKQVIGKIFENKLSILCDSFE